MNSLSFTSCVRLPRALLLLAAFLLPQLAFGYFSFPSNPTTGTSYPIGWSGYAYGTSYTLIQTQQPGSGTWYTFGSGSVSGSYSTINSQFSFNTTGSWPVRVINGSNSTVIESSSIYINASANQPPAPTISVDGRSYGETVPLSSAITVRYGATDVNGNLSGIRYNLWNATTGYFDNGGGGFVSQSGSSGEVTLTFTLSTPGDWYVWTDAQDSAGAYASTGDWGSGFKLTVSENAPPSPTISIDGRSYGETVSTNTTVTVRYGATDSNGNLSGIRYNLWNATTGYFSNGPGFIAQSGGSGLVTMTFTLSTDGDWYFWTDAEDTDGAYASTGHWDSGFKLTVTSGSTYTLVPYEPWYWNDGSSVQYYNNCYNYANNRVTYTFAQPGYASGNMYSDITVSEVADGAISDGLIPTNSTAPIPAGYTRIALVIDPYYDFHWYRTDQGGLWSHKPGGTQATNVDNSGNPITNPETADRGSYTEFGGYFFTPAGTTQGAGTANIQ